MRRADHTPFAALVPVGTDRSGSGVGIKGFEAEPRRYRCDGLRLTDIEALFKNQVAQGHPDLLDQYRITGAVRRSRQGEARHRGSREGVDRKSGEEIGPHRGAQCRDLRADVLRVEWLTIDEFKRPGPDAQTRFSEPAFATPVDQRVQSDMGERAQDIGEDLNGCHCRRITGR